MQFPGLTEEMCTRIRAIPTLTGSFYQDLDIGGTLDFFTRSYVQPLAQRFDIAHATAVDCGAGHGWFSIAYLLAGGKATITADAAATRLEAAEAIAHIFGVSNQMRFIPSKVEALPLEAGSAELFVSIETLEHIGKPNIRPALQHIGRIASQGLLITTPNKLFPVVPHDTRLPFLHWLPGNRRKGIARLLGREKKDQGNEFVSPFDLQVLMEKFRPDTVCQTFNSFDEYRAHFPIYKPYGTRPEHRLRAQPPRLQAAYYRVLCALLGCHSYWAMPSMACIFVRR